MEKYIAFLFLIIINAFSYRIKFVLEKNGYSTSWIWTHFQDIPNMYELAKKTDDSSLRIQRYLLAIGVPIGMLCAAVLFFFVSMIY